MQISKLRKSSDEAPYGGIEYLFSIHYTLGFWLLTAGL
jgi:hypothetical protein